MVPGKSLIVHVGGARGAGKSFVLSRMSQSFTLGMPIVVMPASAFVMELGRERFNCDWDELSVAEKEEMRKAFVECLKKFSQGICVLDSHYVDVLPGGKVASIIPAELYPLIGCHAVVDCSGSASLSRRKADRLKIRSLDKKLIERERHGELVVAEQIARETGVPFHVIPNEQDADCAAECLGDIIRAQWRHLSHSSPPTPPK